MAHVLEGGTAKWWRFDDERVTAMPEGPIGEKADHGVAAGAALSAKKVRFCKYGTLQLAAAGLFQSAMLAVNAAHDTVLYSKAVTYLTTL